MLSILIKYFFIAFCSLFMFSKFINLRLNTKKLLLCIPYSALASVSVYLVQTYAAFLNLTVLFLLLFLFALIAYKNSIRTNVVITTLSLGFSFFLYVISLAVCVPVCYVIYKYMGTTDLSYSLAFLSVGAVQTVLSCLVFRIKRFKKGLTVLEKVSNNDVGMVISILLLFAASLFYSSNINSFITLCLVFLIIFCGVVFVIWWKRHLERGYHAKIYQRNIAALESKIDEQTQEIDNLKQQNEELSKLIHRDNKLIPAMESAVKLVLKNSDDSAGNSGEYYALLNQLESLSSERKNAIKSYETQSKKLPSTDVLSTDGVFNYLLSRANEIKAEFDIVLAGSVKYLTGNIISEEDFNTLAADLGENAIISVRSQNDKKVLISIGTEEREKGSIYRIDIFDSGPNFDVKVLLNMGVSRTTTHRDSGGSGIGLMTTFELLKKYNGSFELDEALHSDIYRKKVSICFDNLRQYRIRTDRQEVAAALKKREDVIFL